MFFQPILYRYSPGNRVSKHSTSNYDLNSDFFPFCMSNKVYRFDETMSFSEYFVAVIKNRLNY